MAKEEMVKIALKKGIKGPISKTIGTTTVEAKPGKAVEVPRSELDRWLGSGRFDLVTDLAKMDAPAAGEEAKAKPPADATAEARPAETKTGGDGK